MSTLFLDLASLNKKKIFWIINIGGWFGIYLLITIYDSERSFSWQYTYLGISYYISGFGLTIFLRRFFKSRLKKIPSILHLLSFILLSGFLSTLMVYFLHIILCFPIYLRPTFSETLQNQKLITFFIQILTSAHIMIIFLVFCTWNTLYFGINSWWNLTEEKDRANQAQLMTKNAELAMLRYQLNPHFLFNSLNSIWALADDDPKATKCMITELSEFLRYSLISNDKTTNPLEYELDALKNYFAIEKRRYQSNLIVEFDIDPATRKIPVISFLIQPFIENAIKFGMKTSPMPLRIRISTERKGNCLLITIFNTGRWIEPKNANRFYDVLTGTGIGLNNAFKRLEIVYPKQHIINIEKDSSFVRVNIEINLNHES